MLNEPFFEATILQKKFIQKSLSRHFFIRALQGKDFFQSEGNLLQDLKSRRVYF
jgi:hypothetical protein